MSTDNEKEQPDAADEQNTDDEDEGRPPVDPKNKLYTFLSLLIFAVLYAGWHFIKENVYFAYALYDDAFSPEEKAVVLRELGLEDMPDGTELKYVRIHKNFDSDTLYAAFSLPSEMAEEEDFPESIFPFSFGDPVTDERLTVYPEADTVPDYVYGDVYSAMENPYLCCMIYENDEDHTAVYRFRNYKGSIRSVMNDCEKIPVK